jgi:hypothetical protein
LTVDAKVSQGKFQVLLNPDKPMLKKSKWESRFVKISHDELQIDKDEKSASSRSGPDATRILIK